MTSESDETPNWQIEKICTNLNNYELSVVKEKNTFHCDQKRESWKWMISYHGTVMASGSVNTLDEAKELAISNVPA